MSERFQIIFFFLYGAVLAVVAFELAGFGHGSYLLLGLAGSPFAVVGLVGAFIACIGQWGLLAIARLKWRLARTFSAGFLLVHYAVAAALLFVSRGDYGYHVDPATAPQLPNEFRFLLIGALIWYVCGQAFLWRVILRPLLATRDRITTADPSSLRSSG